MIRKKVLVHGSPNSLQDFFNSKFNSEYAPLAIVTYESNSVTLTKSGGGYDVEVIVQKDLPRFVYNLVDGVVLTNRSNFNDDVNYFLSNGLEARKIILWNGQGSPEFIKFKQNDGTEVVFMEGLRFHFKTQENLRTFNQVRMHLQRQKQFYALQPSQYADAIATQYKRFTGQDMHWNSPKTFTDKIQWMKLYDSTPIKTRLADKYLVRQWVADKIGAQYLIPLLGVWDNFKDIDFDLLPKQFVLKCNHGCNFNIIVKDKNNLDKETAREKINAWLNIDFGTSTYELHYNNIKKKIIAEKFMQNGNLPDLIDYKFLCFNGKPVYCQYLTNRSIKLTLDYFDMNWQHTNIERSDHPNSEHPENIRKPKNFKLMKKLATELCKGFNFVRVDFYEIEGAVYFGEMTFTPGAGMFRYNSVGTNEQLGNMITLPEPYEFKLNIQ